MLNEIYSKTCVKRPLKIDKTKILMTNGSLMKVEIIAECSCNTFDLHQAKLGLEKQFLAFLGVAVLHRFTVLIFNRYIVFKVAIISKSYDLN